TSSPVGAGEGWGIANREKSQRQETFRVPTIADITLRLELSRQAEMTNIGYDAYDRAPWALPRIVERDPPTYNLTTTEVKSNKRLVHDYRAGAVHAVLFCQIAPLLQGDLHRSEVPRRHHVILGRK